MPATTRRRSSEAAVERKLRPMMREMYQRLGPDGFQEMIVRVVLDFEDELRRTCPADHPGLLLIDEWRATQPH